MSVIVFYEKPGCATNARQKQMLRQAGHEVIARDLLSEPWSATALLDFFGATPVASWFNPAAPRVKSGDIDPSRITAQAALDAMIRDPLLIRRPLIAARGLKCAGFDHAPVPALLSAREEDEDAAADLEACRRKSGAPSCPPPAFPDKT